MKMLWTTFKVVWKMIAGTLQIETNQMLYGPYPRLWSEEFGVWVPDYSWSGTKPRVDAEVDAYYAEWVDSRKE